ncbi:uncharacterized protein K452DRAFT_308403 [Aplosporella prunicola CBS 121167]|uniref:Uncharacterized protein n=1 Tax=Aplosporella prunicola CBS 121167 TaxID=1176127 RepID=A0A6A6BFH4_9PEZI|nr:uncharacterized protein K452DRAFT_308403 [Aplosporella prunicola CBS 121167]KAF2141994.1 hypothetical protein K452DRAFT_308403 [Aplosporella prunicola CBS 121167]
MSITDQEPAAAMLIPPGHELDYIRAWDYPEGVSPISIMPASHTASDTYSMPASGPVENFTEDRSNFIGPPTAQASNCDLIDQGHTTEKEALPVTINWKAPAWMGTAFILGAAFSIAHHVFYKSLDNTLVTSQAHQEFAIRIGTGLTFLTKSFFTAAVGAAFVQYFWVTVKKKHISVSGLDEILSLTTDPTSFCSIEVLLHAKILALLAAIMWLIPLVTTLTPGTLSVQPVSITNITSAEVPYIDFSSENPTNNSVLLGTWEGAANLMGASPSLRRLLSATAASASIASMTAPSPNSSYTLDFYGPTLKCENVSTTGYDKNDISDYGPLKDVFVAKLFNTTPPSVYYRAVAPYDMCGYILVRAGVPEKRTNFTFDLAFSDGVQSTVFRQVDLISPTNYTNADFSSKRAPGTLEYQTMFLALADILVGDIGEAVSSHYGEDEKFFLTGLPGCREFYTPPRAGYQTGYEGLFDPFPAWMCRNRSLATAIEDLTRNFTLSLFATATNKTTTVPVNATFLVNHYAYNAIPLLASYGTVLFVTLASIAVGFAAIWTNGYAASTSFSSIVLASRNKDLDHLAQGRSLGARPLAKDIAKTKLRYGLLQSKRGVTQPAFGLGDSVAPLKKGMVGAF